MKNGTLTKLIRMRNKQIIREWRTDNACLWRILQLLSPKCFFFTNSSTTALPLRKFGHKTGNKHDSIRFPWIFIQQAFFKFYFGERKLHVPFTRRSHRAKSRPFDDISTMIFDVKKILNSLSPSTTYVYHNLKRTMSFCVNLGANTPYLKSENLHYLSTVFYQNK